MRTLRGDARDLIYPGNAFPAVSYKELFEIGNGEYKIDQWRRFLVRIVRIGLPCLPMSCLIPRTPWGDFPPVVFQTITGSAKKHPRYHAAKAGDVDAALEIVTSLVRQPILDEIGGILAVRKPWVIPVMAEEASGRNKLPSAYATVLARYFGLENSVDIVQTVRAKHPGADAFHRIAVQPQFGGRVVAGQEYLIVDDTMTIGGTLANLRGYIETNGGKVLLASTLTGLPYGSHIALTNPTLYRLRRKHGRLEPWWKSEFGFGFDCLTEGEAGHLAAAPDADAIRNRISDARRKAGTR